MSNLLHLLGLIAGVLTQGIAQAPSGGADPVEGTAWRTVFESSSLSAYLDSAAVVSTRPGSYHVRVRWEHATRQTRRLTREAYDVVEVQEELDCEQREHAPDRYRFFLQGNLVADEAVEPEEHRWKPFASGRVQDLAYTRICSLLDRPER